ncbi:hypothetical protein [Longimicrobium sp.]|uniref:hypothetical protein n=1 Tax=Longimicrobium sp. TaxID=2029185 RepID=UPI003B3A098E
MAAERDQAGTSGPGLSGTGRDSGATMRAGTSGSSSMGDRGLGSAEVHTGLHSGGNDEYSGLQFAGRESQGGVGGRLRDVADRVGGPVRNLAGNLGPRVSDAAEAVRDRTSGVRERATTALEKGGMLSRLRENPLPVLGVAFAIGFLLAARDDDDEFGESNRGRARSELRDALMAGVTAGLAQGARGFLNQAGSESTGFVNTLMDAFLGQTGGGNTGGSTGGGALSGGGTYGSTGGSASRTNRGGSTAGSAGRSGAASRPPSHQEY